MVTAVAAPVELPDEVSASAAARKFGQPVRIASRTTESSEVVANPNGSYTLTRSLEATRVRRGGNWVPLDMTLRKQQDGSVAPAAAGIDVRIAGAGTGKPLVVLGEGGREVGLGWDGSLPEPVLDGKTATYPEVMPGVDLVINVGSTGFSQLLVVKTPQAAQNPKLRRITFGSHTKGGVRVTESSSALEVRDGLGDLVFTGDASRMWDSANRQAKMEVEVTDDRLTIVPDQGLLTDPATRYPVSIDPSYFFSGGKNHHVVVQSGIYAGNRNYDRTDAPLNDLKAGYIPDENGMLSRSFVEMHFADMVDKVIDKATLNMNVIYSASCTGGLTEVWLTPPISPQTSWNNQPGLPQFPQDGTTKSNRGNCPSDGYTEFNILPAAHDGVTHNYAHLTFAIVTKNEGAPNDWRRFALNPTIGITYNSYPNPPSELGMEGGQIPCANGASRPYVFTKTPRLRARVSDPDGGVLHTDFPLHRGPITGSTRIGLYTRRDTPSGSFAEVTVPPGIISTDGVYNWSAISSDTRLTSNYGGNCEFAVDSVPPVEPGVTSDDYPSSDPAGGVGVTGTFELSAAVSTDVVYYLYSFTDKQNDDPTIRVNANGLGGKANIRWTPVLRGTQTLFVRSVDRAGNKSSIRRHQVNVLPGSGPVGHWKLDSDFADASGNQRTLVPTNGATATAEGYSGRAAGLDGIDDALSHPTMIDSSQSFTISAWAKLDRLKPNWSAVAAMNGTNANSAYLQYSDVAKRWAFGASTSDIDNPSSAAVTSGAPPLLGVWTHLGGVYDVAAGKLTFYVDGVRQGEVAARPWKALGDFNIGREKRVHEFTDYFPGQIDDVRVYDRAINSAEAIALANQSALRAHYALNEGTGTTTKDEVTNRQATLNGPASWSDNDGYTSASFPSNSHISGPAPTIRADRSYSVSAWVYLDTADVTRTAVSLVPASGQGRSPFLIGYREDLKDWGFMTSTPTGSVMARSPGRAQVGEWVHLAGVYDAAKAEIHLYVNGQFVSSAQGVPKSPHGDFTVDIGRAFWDGQPITYWKGLVDDVRVHAGALTDLEITQLLVRQ